MKIARVRAYSVTYPAGGAGYQLSGGRHFLDFKSAIVRLDTDEGISGWGEHASSPMYMPSLHTSAVAAIAHMATNLIGMDPRQTGVINHRMDFDLQGHSYAKSAIDIACWDIAGRAAGVPAAVLLGGIYQTEFPLIDVVRLSDPARMKDRTDELYGRGFKVVQVKVGGDWRVDVERLRTLWPTAERFNTVIADANAHWKQHEALQVVNAMADTSLMFEQPCRDLEQNVAVRRRTSLPFILDESLDSIRSLHLAQQADAFDCAMLKFSRFGGITALRQARDNCVSWGKSVTMEDPVGSDLTASASAQLAASTPPNNLVAGSFATSFRPDRIGEGIWQKDGVGRLPEGPGLGITVDEGRLGEPVFDSAGRA